MKQNQARKMTNRSARITVFLSVLLVIILLAGVSPAAFAAGPLFHAVPDYQPAPQMSTVPVVTVEALGEANSYEALIRKYGGFAVETTSSPDADGESSYSFFYGTDNYNYYAYTPVMGEDSTLAKLITRADVYSLDQKADGRTEYTIAWDASPNAEENTYDLKATAMALDREALLDYEIDMVVDNGDGTLTVVLVENGPEIISDGTGTDEMPFEPTFEEPFVSEGPDEFFGWTEESYVPYDFEEDWDGAEEWEAEDDAWHEGDDTAFETPVEWDPDAYTWTDEPYTWEAYSGGYRGSQAPYEEPFAAPYGWRNDYTYRWYTDPYAPSSGWQTPADAWDYRMDNWDITPDAWYDDGFGQDMETFEPFEEAPEWEDDGNWYDDEDFWTEGWDAEGQSVLTFVVDARTLEIRSIRESAVLENGREVLCSDQTVSYTTPDSQTLNDMLVMSYHYENEDIVNPRTVTVVYDYGTMDETLVSRTVEKGDLLYTSFLPGYLLYSDTVGTPFEGSDGQSDVTIFAYPYDKVWAEEERLPFELPAAGEPVSDMTELDYDATNYEIYEANKLSRILENHSSVEYRLVFSGEDLPGCPDYVYETADMSYAESPTTAVYVGDGKYYELSDNAAGSNLYYVFDFSNDYDPFLNAGYEIVPEAYEDWWNPDEETAIRCYEENGEIHLISESSPEKSRSFVEDYLQLTYNGEAVTSEAIADAETGELIRFIYRMEKDGVVTQPLTYEVAYDQPVPRACRNLRAAAERDAEQVAVITLIANPGTAEEQVQTKTLPAGSNAVYVADEWMALYEDEACTVPAGQWDKMTDHTYYMIPVSQQADAA